MTTEYFINTINAARLDLLDITENVGGVATLLREADDDERRDSRTSALLCLDDALNLVSTIEAQASALAAKIANLAGGPSHS